MNLLEQIERALSSAEAMGGMHEVMRAEERKVGRRVVVPGEEPWISADDWDQTCVVSIDGRQVRLIAILARNPGRGSLRRMVEAIISADLKPCIVCPTREMRETLKRWNWRERKVGRGWEQEERWSPREGKQP